MLPGDFVILGVALQLVGVVAYLVDLFARRVSPHPVTWLLWGVPPLIAFAAQLENGVGREATLTLAAGLGPLAVFVSGSLMVRSMASVSKGDLALGCFSILGVALWVVSKDAAYAIALAILADLLASFPTLAKCWRDPRSESRRSYAFLVAGAIVALLTVRSWTFSSVSFLLYLAFLGSTLCLVLTIRGPGKRYSAQRASSVALPEHAH